MDTRRNPIPSARACDSCGDILRPGAIYIGFIGSLDQHVCPACAAYHSAGQYTLYQIATAQQIIRQHQHRLSVVGARRKPDAPPAVH